MMTRFAKARGGAPWAPVGSPCHAVRRWMAAAVVGALATLPIGIPKIYAQEKPLRIGVLALGPRWMPAWRCGPLETQGTAPEARAEALDPNVPGLKGDLEKLGYVEDRPENKDKPGRRFLLDVRTGNLEALRRFAQQFTQQRVDLILAITTPPALVAQEATRANPIPIIFTAVSDPVGEGFAQSLSRPGGRMTGISTQLIQGSGKRVEMFKEMVPGMRRVLTMYKADYRVAEQSMTEMRMAAADQGMTLVEKHASNRTEVQAVLSEIRRGGVDGFIFAVDAVAVSNADLVIDRGLRQRVPIFGILDFMAEWGALGAYGPSPYQQGRRAAYYVDKIARGTKPGDLPVEPMDPTFVVNLRTAACLGLALPPAVLHQADRVIR